MISRTSWAKVPEYATYLFSGSNTTTLVMSVSPGLGVRATKFRTVADAADAVGTKGGETMTR
jgi:hypothetical protein